MDQSNMMKLAVAAVLLFVAYKMFVARKEGFAALPGTMLDDAATGVPQLPPGCQPPLSVSTDLLPKPQAAMDDFAMYAPSPDVLQNQNFLDATKFVGIDTVGQTLKNANYQLRADIPNPRVPVGPWNQSTIESGSQYQRPLE